MPTLCLKSLYPQGEGPPMQTSSLQIPPRVTDPNPMPFFFFLSVLPVYVEIFLAALFVQYENSSASFQISVRIAPHVDVFLMCLWEEVSSTSVLLLRHLDSCQKQLLKMNSLGFQLLFSLNILYFCARASMHFIQHFSLFSAERLV